MKNFKQLKIWQKGIQIAAKSFKLTEGFPNEHKFGLANQITRAAISIPSNIAEGSSRNSEKDYKRFLEISLGSAFELESQLMISETVKIGNESIRTELLKDIDEEQKMLLSFMAKLNK
jgi:four helix bundle protein